MMKKRVTGKASYTAKSRDKKRDGSVSGARKRPGPKAKRPDESDAVAWLLHYMRGAFPLPFGDAHYRIIEAVTYAIKHGGNVAIAAPRGTGKSTLVNGLVLWALLTKRTAFPVVLPWDDKARKRALRFWAQELCHNATIHRDYPEQTDILMRSRGIANRLASLTQDGKATGARLGLNEGLIVLPNGLGAIGSATINGNPRGLNYATIDGKIIRPTFAIIDDPQDRETAKSKSRVADTVDVINGDIAGMAGPDQRMAMVMPCTVIERDDVAEHYLKHPDWTAIRVAQVTAWPTGWNDTKSEARRLWAEWNNVRQGGESDRDGGKAAVEFYKANMAAMTEGMAVSWEHRFDKRRGQPDALYSAMFDYYMMGHDAFMAERQNEPVVEGVTLYNLTPSVIMSRMAERDAGQVPEWSVLRVAATDVNASYGLTWAECAIGRDQTAAVLAYGIHPTSIGRDATPAEWERRVFEALVIHGKELAAMPCAPNIWLIDAGGQAFDVVNRFSIHSTKLCGIQAIPATGRGARTYRPYGKMVVGTPREQCHTAMDAHGRKWVAFNADYWRERAQKAWTGSVGAPGSCSLPRGHHREFAEQICREQLAGKGEVGGQMVWTWNTLPGAHDFGDAMTMCFVGAALQGIGTGGARSGAVKSRYVERRRPRVEAQI